MIGTPLMCEAVFALHPPDLRDSEILPEIRDQRPLLRLHTAEILRDLTVAPFEMPFLLHNEDRLRETIYRVVHHVVDIADDAHTVSVKTALPITAALPCEQSKQHP